MAFNIQTLFDGRKWLILNIVADGATVATPIVDVSALNPPCADVNLHRADYDIPVIDAEALSNQVTLSWDATVAVPFLIMSSSNGQTRCWEKLGGIYNPMIAAGSTGDVVMSSDGECSVVLKFRKKY